MPIGATIGAVGSIGSGVLGYFGAKKASKQQAKAQQAALEVWKPYADMGKGAMTTLSGLFGIGGGQPFSDASLAAWRNTPGYRFALGEGLRSTDFGDAARGTLLSSNNLRNRSEFAHGLADRTFMGSYVQPLLSLAGIGAGGAQGAATALGNIGTAQAAGTVGGFNALGQGISGAANNLMLWNMMNGSKSAYGGSPWTSGQFQSEWNQASPTPAYQIYAQSQPPGFY